MIKLSKTFIHFEDIAQGKMDSETIFELAEPATGRFKKMQWDEGYGSDEENKRR